MDILIETKNQYKATEILFFLGNHPGVKVHFWEELGLEIKVEEDQPTLKKNAEKKAAEISGLTDWYVLASDGGVDIPGLAKKGKLIWSTEQISDRGFIAESLPDSKIPPYRWMGHLWYYPQYKRGWESKKAWEE